jgi:hypothetical protein
MKTRHHCAAASGLAALLTLSGCAEMNTHGNAAGTPQGHQQSTLGQTTLGVVQSIDLVRLDDGVAGGSRIDVAATAGVDGVYGNPSNPSGHTFKFTVRINDGRYKSVTQSTNADIRVGDRVQIANGVVSRY